MTALTARVLDQGRTIQVDGPRGSWITFKTFLGYNDNLQCGCTYSEASCEWWAHAARDLAESVATTLL